MVLQCEFRAEVQQHSHMKRLNLNMKKVVESKFESAALSNREALVTSAPSSSLVTVTRIVPHRKWHFLNQFQSNIICQLLYFPAAEWVRCLVSHVDFSIFCQHLSCIVKKTPHQVLMKPVYIYIYIYILSILHYIIMVTNHIFQIDIYPTFVTI